MLHDAVFPFNSMLFLAWWVPGPEYPCLICMSACVTCHWYPMVLAWFFAIFCSWLSGYVFCTVYGPIHISGWSITCLSSRTHRASTLDIEGRMHHLLLPWVMPFSPHALCSFSTPLELIDGFLDVAEPPIRMYDEFLGSIHALLRFMISLYCRSANDEHML